MRAFFITFIAALYWPAFSSSHLLWHRLFTGICLFKYFRICRGLLFCAASALISRNWLLCYSSLMCSIGFYQPELVIVLFLAYVRHRLLSTGIVSFLSIHCIMRTLHLFTVYHRALNIVIVGNTRVGHHLCYRCFVICVTSKSYHNHFLTSTFICKSMCPKIS